MARRTSLADSVRSGSHGIPRDRSGSIPDGSILRSPAEHRPMTPTGPFGSVAEFLRGDDDPDNENTVLLLGGRPPTTQAFEPKPPVSSPPIRPRRPSVVSEGSAGSRAELLMQGGRRPSASLLLRTQVDDDEPSGEEMPDLPATPIRRPSAPFAEAAGLAAPPPGRSGRRGSFMPAPPMPAPADPPPRRASTPKAEPAPGRRLSGGPAPVRQPRKVTVHSPSSSRAPGRAAPIDVAPLRTPESEEGDPFVVEQTRLHRAMTSPNRAAMQAARRSSGTGVGTAAGALLGVFGSVVKSREKRLEEERRSEEQKAEAAKQPLKKRRASRRASIAPPQRAESAMNLRRGSRRVSVKPSPTEPALRTPLLPRRMSRRGSSVGRGELSASSRGDQGSRRASSAMSLAEELDEIGMMSGPGGGPLKPWHPPIFHKRAKQARQHAQALVSGEEAERASILGEWTEQCTTTWSVMADVKLLAETLKLLDERRKLQERGWLAQRQKFVALTEPVVTEWRKLCLRQLRVGLDQQKLRDEEEEDYKRRDIRREEDDDRFSLHIQQRDEVLVLQVPKALRRSSIHGGQGLILYGGCPFKHQYNCPFTKKRPRLGLNELGLEKHHLSRQGAQTGYGMALLPPERVIQLRRDGYTSAEQWQRTLEEPEAPPTPSKWKMGEGRSLHVKSKSTTSLGDRQRKNVRLSRLAEDQIAAAAAEDEARQEQRKLELLKEAAQAIPGKFEEVRTEMKHDRGKHNLGRLSNAARSLIRTASAGEKGSAPATPALADEWASPRHATQHVSTDADTSNEQLTDDVEETDGEGDVTDEEVSPPA